jgi:NAD(P)-dependent dehydrogenase (short-subunit alcohol dehydrogenase family)
MTTTDKPVALIIGAGDHLGSAIARRFAKEGFHLVVTRRRGDLDLLSSEIQALGSSATAIHSDARDEDQVIELIERVESEHGPIRVAVFNVGGNVRYDICETSTRVYRKVWEMCALAGFLVGREVARKMLQRNEGTLLFTGASASLRGGRGFAAFAGGKHALRALAQSPTTSRKSIGSYTTSHAQPGLSSSMRGLSQRSGNAPEKLCRTIRSRVSAGSCRS